VIIKIKNNTIISITYKLHYNYSKLLTSNLEWLYLIKLIKEIKMSLKGTKTKENLEAAFAGESQANRRYLYFAQKADIEGYNDVASVFRSTAEGETGHAHGHLEYLEEVGDPATGLPIGETKANLASAVQGETHEYTDMYPGMAKTAREEGFEEIAEWFETLAKAEKSHAGKFQKTLESIS
jgi:rubrerythrin